MRKSFATLAGPAVLVAAVAALSSTPIHGQRVPNFSGVYDVATMTPLERPAEFKGRATLTRAEAREIEEYEAKRQETAAAPDDPNRAAPPVGGDTSPTKSYLEQLFAKLRRGGLVRSVRGPGGGYLPAHPISEMRVSDIILAVDEPIRATRCAPGSPSGCRQNRSRCLTHDLWEEQIGRAHV